MSSKVTFDFPPELHRELKILAAERNTTMRALILECAEKLVQEREKESSKNQES